MTFPAMALHVNVVGRLARDTFPSVCGVTMLLHPGMDSRGKARPYLPLPAPSVHSDSGEHPCSDSTKLSLQSHTEHATQSMPSAFESVKAILATISGTRTHRCTS